MKEKAQERLDKQRAIQASYESSYNNSYSNSYDSSHDYIPSSYPSTGTYGTSTVSNNEPTVSINGIPCAISALRTIDSYICTNQDSMAIQELRRITGFSEDEAKEIVDNWFMYYK